MDESMWQLPVTRAHRKAITSTIADITNSPKGDRYGGASTAAAFLENFVNKDTKWVHIDIAGPSTKGGIATGFSTQTIVNYLIKQNEKNTSKETNEFSGLNKKI